MNNVVRNRKFVYIGHADDIPKFEEVAGKVEDAMNWEATRLGLHVEVDLTPEQTSRIQSLPSVSVYDEAQHELTAEEEEMHRRMRWSKRAVDEHNRR